MSVEFAGDLDIALSGFESIDGADVVQTPAGHKCTTGGISTRHHPRGAKGDGVDFVSTVGVPHYQLTILTRTHQVSEISKSSLR